MSEGKQVIAVLGGTGHEGAGLAARWAKAGHKVIVGSRDAARAAESARDLAAASGGEITGMGNLDAAAAGEIVVLAVPYAAQQALAREVRAQLEGKIVIDVTVPLQPPKVARVQLPEGGSAVEALQRMLGEGVRVVSAFQNVSAHQLSALDQPVDCDVLVAGDDVEARETVCQLARAIGIAAWHAGPLANSAAAEALTSVLIAINKRYKVANGAGIRITGLPDPS
jgi:8-hydroxy-5-deazaflavin:NADPH oxidoreductase